MTIDLFPFQAEDVAKLKSQRSRLVGNDPGTGKTYEGIALDLENRIMHRKAGLPDDYIPRKAKTLILCPKSVISVWDEHCMDLTDLDVYVIDAKHRDIFLRDATDPSKGGYFIMHWDALRFLMRDPKFQKIGWFHVIGDEIHRVKNRKAQVKRAANKIKAYYKTGMSGTPADNRPQDLWGVLNWLFPSYYTAYWPFVNAYCKWETVDPKTGEPYGYKKFIGMNEERLPRLHKEMEPWFTRRRKEDVLPDLPPKYYSRVWVDLAPKQRRAYDQMRRTMVAWVEDHQGEIDEGNPVIARAIVSQLIRLQQYADGYVVPRLDAQGNQIIKVVIKTDKKTGLKKRLEFPQWDIVDPSAKLDALMEILEDRPDEQVIIWSTFRSAIDLVGRRLDAKGIPYGTLTGDVSQPDRARNVAEFQSGRTKAIIGTIATGGVGITLTASSTVIFIDRSWSPAINTQAEDRAHRIGQENAVEVIDLMARNTVDLGKAQQLRQKTSWLAQLLGDTVPQDLLTFNLEAEMKGITDILTEEGEDVA